MADSFVFYRSFLNQIHLAPANERLRIYEDLVKVCLGDKTLDEVPYPYNLFIGQAFESVKNAQKNHSKSVEDGAKGGRPNKWVDRAEAEKLYAELKSWDKVADAMGVDRKTLYKAKHAWSTNNPNNPKNLNVNDNVNTNDNANVNIISINNNNKVAQDSPASSPVLPPLPDGSEYVGKPVQNKDGYWFVTVRDEIGCEEVVYL